MTGVPPLLQRAERLKRFLTRRRARLRPEDVGLPAGGLRKVSGLRREEVARLAGISTTWYTLFERGARRDVSAETVGAIARALRLDAAETGFLHALTQTPPETAAAAPVPDDILAEIVHHAERVGMLRYDAQAAIVDANRLAAALSGYASTGDAAGNVTYRRLFLEPAIRRLYPEWETYADRVVATLQFASARWREPPGWLAEMLAIPEFRTRWERTEILPDTGVVLRQRIDHPRAGTLDVLIVATLLSAEGYLVHYVGADDGSRERMRSLAVALRQD